MRPRVRYFSRERVLGFGFLLMVTCASAYSDELHLTDGSLVRGTILNIKDGVATVKTDFAGELKVSIDKISGVSTDTEQTVTLKGGGVHTGRLEFIDGHQRVRQGGTAQDLALPDVAETAPLPVLGAEAPPANWTGRAELGLKGNSGNTERFDVQALVSTTRTNVLSRLTLTLRGQYEEADAVRTRSEVLAGLRYERDLSPRFFAFTRLELEYDEFENLDLRSTVAGGLGYFLVRSPRQDFKVRLGAAYQHEEFGDGSSDDKPLLETGYDYRLDVRQWLRYTSTLTYFVDPGDTSDWRLSAENAADVPLGITSPWKIRLGVRNEYDAEPLPDIERLDTSYYLSLVYAWN